MLKQSDDLLNWRLKSRRSQTPIAEVGQSSMMTVGRTRIRAFVNGISSRDNVVSELARIVASIDELSSFASVLAAAPRDQRSASGAVCPKQGKGAALILPACNIPKR